ncbi:hypothetical protein SEA_KABOCHA_121 [Gordonia phage Kabocha]|uniref:Uncharacterized protein n=1 Tax=Gordonia phage Chidiebere TaxID=2656530 RepID=A0A649VKT0_9CAUD|nr:hypothetical protein PQD14_gp120 [Gordonia phage Chidiebere]AZS07967.1 hypothetical protein PBI_GRAY_117 [Gordonia phage Gray]WAA19907.1 hypothetical protein SEA_KABOCHA_121 [Gordonia phage Kabocha]WAA20096.1 hypothetical protein SEA_HANEM_119 [Gordonia phage Hanem]WNM67139.1 hypothetical protein SEA_SCHOMBER_118 [Gordonia Phage Schomber]QGJ93006.1 hypothetical protein PBI_CHIDIEBERE_120 [Gordonia phage Chidiebere]
MRPKLQGAHMTNPTQIDEDDLVVRGRVLSRYDNRPMFRSAQLSFFETNTDNQAQITRVAETLNCPMGDDGRFDVRFSPSTNGAGFVCKLTLVGLDGRLHVEHRTLPATGIVDFFQCPEATELTNTRWPNGETPILVSDYNKPGGPLQLTDNGTIDNDHIPGDFLRVDDPRVENITLSNYVTKMFYEADQLTRNSISIHFSNQEVWEFDHGLPHTPLVECVEDDGSVLQGAVTYPVGTNKVRVEFDAPTTGTLIVR